MQFHERLRNEREDNDMTQKQLGDAVNMSQRKISYLEKKQTEPTPEEIIAICKFFNRSADYMLGLKDE
ncbi:MAG: helix-turn-helix transcriptional regulator [Clostridia bacterium]|nr:helix-turn-helix transcriptional regulator [Clostridia bacterium]MBQ6863661.1 helix-turn-helix transcriptional regulator [Clostridia bacterium]